MGDVFKETATLDFPDGTDIWAATSFVYEKLRTALRGVAQNAQDGVQWVEATDGSKFDRPTLSEMKSAIEAEGLTPQKIVLMFGSGPGYGLHAQTVTRVHLSAHFPGSWGSGIRVSTESPSRLAVDGLQASARRAQEHFISAPTLMITSHSDTITSTAAARVQPPIAPSQSRPHSEAAVAIHNERSWLARTWRDHTATFVVTTLAGVVVAIVLVAFGLNG